MPARDRLGHLHLRRTQTKLPAVQQKRKRAIGFVVGLHDDRPPVAGLEHRERLRPFFAITPARGRYGSAATLAHVDIHPFVANTLNRRLELVTDVELVDLAVHFFVPFVVAFFAAPQEPFYRSRRCVFYHT